MKKSLFLFAVLCSIICHSQSFTAQVLDGKNNPIPFATVQTGINSGVITNEEGYFTIFLEDVTQNELTFSCLGFSKRTVPIDTIKKANNIVVLNEYVDQLDQVYLSGTQPNADSIIARVNRSLSKNYNHENIKYNLFFRNTSYVDFGDLEFKLTKATGFKKRQLTNVNKSFDSLASAIADSKTVHFKDYLADLYLLNKENSKLDVIKATSMIDQKKNVSVDQIQEKAQGIFLKYLDTTKTYKVKTGILKVEDSLSLSDTNNDEKPKNEYTTENLRNETHELLHTSQVYDNTTLQSILDKNLYEYKFVDVIFHNDELIYIINFKPRRAKAKFAGRLYIADDSYAVVKADYAFANGKRGSKLNLKLILGIKYVENVKNGTIIFKKNSEGKYQPQYVREEYGNYFYVNRPLKFIENGPKKNKVGFNFLIEGDMREKNEILFISESEITTSQFEGFKENEGTPYLSLDRYDPSVWQSHQALEPLEEMKSFKVGNNED